MSSTIKHINIYLEGKEMFPVAFSKHKCSPNTGVIQECCHLISCTFESFKTKFGTKNKQAKHKL